MDITKQNRGSRSPEGEESEYERCESEYIVEDARESYLQGHRRYFQVVADVTQVAEQFQAWKYTTNLL